MSLEFRRRLGRSPKDVGTSDVDKGCPDLWELTTGDFAVIGEDMTEVLTVKLPPSAKLSPGERIVVIPRITLLDAGRDIPTLEG